MAAALRASILDVMLRPADDVADEHRFEGRLHPRFWAGFVVSGLGSASIFGPLGRTPLWSAAERGDATTVAKVLSAGASVDSVHNGATPLWVAVRNGCDNAVSTLLKAKADADRPNGDGVRPLAVALQERHTAIVAKLLAAGATVERPHVEEAAL